MVTKYWTRDGFDKSGNRGIAVVVQSNEERYEPVNADDPMGDIVQVDWPEAFEACVVHALAAIYSVPTGRRLLETLDLTGERITLVPCLPSVGNCIRNLDTFAMLNPVAKELLSAPGHPGAITRQALKRAAATQDLGVAAQWLAARINQAPRRPWPEAGAVHEATPYRVDGVHADNIHDWLHTGNPNSNPFNAQRAAWNDEMTKHIKASTIVALEKHSEMGSGSPVSIGWNIYPDYPLNRQRPPAVGLAHELIHAYYSVRGEQPGLEVDHFSTVLFEYKCVGLGPWRMAPISENAIRAQWADAAVSGMDPLQAFNETRPPLRNLYGH